jgi:PKD-like domain/Secretion system C-terminal sorting domain
MISLSAVNAVCQVSSLYTFSSSPGTYTEITGGTIIATATATTGAAALDDVVYDLPAGTIPFSFTFDNIAYTGCKVSTNGFITFGTTAPAASGSATGFTPLSAVTAYSGAVSAFGRNLAGYFFTGNPAQTGQLRYQTLGSAPNRIFVIQYKNFKPFNYSTTSFTSPVNMQIRLKETTNAIDVVYNISGTFGSSILAQVGLRGANNIYPTNINNRSVANAVNTWPTSTTGTTNTSTCEILNTLIPASGLTYSWSLQACPTPLNLGVTNVLLNSAQATWSANGGSGNFKLEYGPQGFTPGTGTVINNAVSPQTISGLAPSTNYAFFVQQICGASGNSPNVGPFNFTSGTAGEDCSTAPLVTVKTSIATCGYTVVTSGVSQNGPLGNCSDATGNLPNDDRWYKFVAPANGKKLIITTTAGTVNDWVMQLWSSCGLNPTDLIRCGDDENAFMPQITLCQNEYTPGQTYYIRAWTYSQTLSGTMNLCVYEDVPCVIAPLNDECISSVRLTVNNSTGCPSGATTYTDLNATPSGDAATCDLSTKNDVWFVFNTGNFGDIRATFTKGTASTLKAQLLFECGGQEIACWNPADGTPKILTGLNPVADYILRVWSDAGTAGTFSICLQDICADPTAIISGNTTICPGNTANLVVAFTGTPPYSFTYFNGTTNATVSNININPYILQATVATTTTFTLVSMSDATCSGTVSGSATVNLIVAPTVTLAPFAPICTNAGIQTLTGGSPAGGVYSGLGVINGTFNPSVGTSTITYTVTYGSGCTKSASQVWTVSTAPVVVLNTFAPVCSNAAPFMLTGGMPGGGTYSGTGVSANMFNPAVAGVGVKIITYTVNSGGCAGSDTATITVNNCAGCPNPPTANAGVDKNSCGTTAVPITGAIGGGATIGTWSSTGTGTFTPNTTTLNVTYNPSAADALAGSVKIYLTTNDPDGAGACVAARDSMIITVLSAPTAGSITGFSNICRSTSGNVYSVPSIAGATFTWTVPTGGTITGQGSNSITVAFSSTAASGNICVTATNLCGSGTQVCKALTVRTTVPGTPGAITGSTNGCNGESKVYSVAAIAAANQYLWTPPLGATINGSSAPFLTNSNSVTVDFGVSFAGDTLKVRAVNCIGQSAQRTLRINKNAPGTPAAITGQAAGLCNLSNIPYSIATVTNATSYTWRTNVVGATINGSSSPVTTTSLSVNAVFGNFVTGNIYVKANNGCGSSAERTLAIAGRPAVPTSITGPTAVCTLQTGVAYSIAAVPFATSYGWTVPTGATIASGGTTTNMTANFGSAAITGNVRARSTNACGSSSYFTLVVTVSICPRVSDDGSVSSDALYMEAYPNPVHGMLQVTLVSPVESNGTMKITDMAGRIVYQESLAMSTGENRLQVNTEGLATGSYILSVNSLSGIVNQRIVVE